MRPRLTNGQFSRRALMLFFIVSLMPALTVSTVWYIATRNLADVNDLISFGSFVAPVALLGLLPAIILGILFAELLAIPIRRLHQGIIRIGNGDLTTQVHFSRISEFREMGDALNAISLSLKQTLAQKERENEVIAAESRKLHSVLNNMSDGVFTLDRTDRIMLFNRAASLITGRSVEHVVGQPLEHVLPLHKDGHSVLVDWLAKANPHAIQNNQWNDLELATADGQIKRINLEVTTLPSDPGGIRLLGTFHDLTKDLELEDKELNFVALAAHELRTPLTTIRGYLDILEMELGKTLSADHHQVLERSILGVNELTHLTNNLLNVSRIENGQLNYQFEPIGWGNFCKELKPDLTARAGHHDRKLVVTIPAGLPQVSIDHLAITEIFYNLVDNAITHTKAGDTITIAIVKTHEGVNTTVSDTGTGIPKEALSKLFHKFYRVEGLKSKGGTGLGLYLSRQIAEAHGGYMWVESEVGQGATFGLFLPQAVASKSGTDNNKAKIIRGTHGWIKTHSHN